MADQLLSLLADGPASRQRAVALIESLSAEEIYDALFSLVKPRGPAQPHDEQEEAAAQPRLPAAPPKLALPAGLAAGGHEGDQAPAGGDGAGVVLRSGSAGAAAAATAADTPTPRLGDAGVAARNDGSAAAVTALPPRQLVCESMDLQVGESVSDFNLLAAASLASFVPRLPRLSSGSSAAGSRAGDEQSSGSESPCASSAGSLLADAPPSCASPREHARAGGGGTAEVRHSVRMSLSALAMPVSVPVPADFSDSGDEDDAQGQPMLPGPSRAGRGGLGRALLAPVNVLRRSLTGGGKRTPAGPAAAVAAASTAARRGQRTGTPCGAAAGPSSGGGAPTSGRMGSSRIAAPAAAAGVSPRPASAAGAAAVQSRLPSFTAHGGPQPRGRRAHHNNGQHRLQAAKFGRGSQARRPGLCGTNATGQGHARRRRAATGLAGRGDRSFAHPIWRQQRRDLRARAQHATPSPRAAAAGANQGAAWLSQHSAQQQQQQQGRAAEASLSALRSAAATPGSRPGSSMSVRPEAATGGAASRPAPRIAASASPQMPRFAVTNQMVAIQHRTPSASPRVATPGSSARGAGASSSKASYVRQLAGAAAADAALVQAVAAAGALAAAGRAAVGGRIPASAAGAGAGAARPGVRPGAQPPRAPSAFAAGAAGLALCDANVGLGSSSKRAVAAEASGAGGASQLRRSRSCGSMADMLLQQRQPWHQQQQHQQHLPLGKEPAMIPVLRTAGQQQAAALHQRGGLSLGPLHSVGAVPQPLACDSPPFVPLRRASWGTEGGDGSSGGGAAAGSDRPAAAGARPALAPSSGRFGPGQRMGELVGRLDVLLAKAGTSSPTAASPSINGQAPPSCLSAPPAARQAAAAATPAAQHALPSSLAAKLLAGAKLGSGADSAGGVGSHSASRIGSGLAKQPAGERTDSLVGKDQQPPGCTAEGSPPTRGPRQLFN